MTLEEDELLVVRFYAAASPTEAAALAAPYTLRRRFGSVASVCSCKLSRSHEAMAAAGDSGSMRSLTTHSGGDDASM